MTAPKDEHHMAAALSLAARQLGATWPNPAVGCVLVREDLVGAEGRVVGRGVTGAGGRPHAETEALKAAGPLAAGATAYVTLEPCCHQGKTPPCTGALIDAGIRRVVIAATDPDPRVSGGGIKALTAAGIRVETGVLKRAAERLNAGFFLRALERRPWITLKLATSLDGRIALASGASKWITGPRARERAHLMRARHDAILVGSGTVLADDPSLTCRLKGLEDRSPVRVVLDGRGRVGADRQVIATADRVPTWRMVRAGTEGLEAHGLETIVIDQDRDGRLVPMSVAAGLAERGVTRLMIEGGGAVAAAFLKAGLVDEVAWFRAPVVLGGDALAAIAGLGLEAVGDGPRFRRENLETLGEDVLERLVRRDLPTLD